MDMELNMAAGKEITNEELRFHDEISRLENCPKGNELGGLKLYRLVENPVNAESFVPYAISKPRLRSRCEAWGLSMFTDLEMARELLASLSSNVRVKYSAIASALVGENDGIKYSLRSNSHYTFFPKADLDLVSKFAEIEPL